MEMYNMKKITNFLLLVSLLIALGNSIPTEINFNTTNKELMVIVNESSLIELIPIANKIKSYTSGLSYSTYLGGSDSEGNTHITVDQEKNVWITGSTWSANFPTTTNAYNRTYGGSSDIFVSKFDGKNGSLLYSTYIGGGSYELPNTIEFDVNNDIWVCGETGSSNFPTTSDACDKVFNGSSDCFLFKLSGINGSLLYSTYIGGSGGEMASTLGIDSQNNVWVTGITLSDNFPTTPLALQPQLNGSIDAFLCKIMNDDGSLGYSTYFGGSGDDFSYSLTFTPSSDIWVTGYTSSTNFPLTPDANDSILNGGSDIFLTKLTGNGTNILYSTYIGGGSSEAAISMISDSFGDIWVTGYTTSSNFPRTTDAYDDTYGGSYDVFLLKFSGNESKYLYSSYFGGNNQDHGRSVQIDTNGYVWVSGETNSDFFPTTLNAYNTTYSGRRDAFILAIAPNLTLAYSTYVGGSEFEVFTDLALDPAGKIWLVGKTDSLNFPTTPNAYNDTHSGGDDAFLFSLTLYSAPQPPVQISAIESAEQDIMLTWQKPDYEGNSPISTYRVYRNSSLIFDNYHTETPFHYYIDETILPEITYYYTVTAVNSYGESEFSEVVSIIIIPSTFHPSAPRNCIGTNGTSFVYLTWDMPLDDGGTPIKNYTIYRREICGVYSLLDNTTETFYNDTSVLEGTTYYYMVKASNNVGEGPASNKVPGKIIDITLPVIDHPNDIEFFEGTPNHIITWQVSDRNPASFIITRNGVLLISAQWNGDNISINVDSLLTGTYLYNCTVIDQTGNSIFDVVEVKVISVTQTSIPSTTLTTTSTTTTLSTTDTIPGYTCILVLAVIFISSFLRKKRK
jgi:hypothetical protein